MLSFCFEFASQAWESGYVGHMDSLTCMCAVSRIDNRGADLLLTGDASGRVIALGPTQKEVSISETSLKRQTPMLQELKNRKIKDADRIIE